ncbi:HEAT repeat domain-containing protein [bacterium]|nr:HEAT repeat domain-containing protein [bacterium]
MPEKSTSDELAEYVDMLSTAPNVAYGLRRIASLGAGAVSALPLVESYLDSQDEDARAQAIRAIGRIAPRDGVAYAQRFTLLLADESDAIALAAAGALAEMGPRASCALPPLRQMLSHSSVQRRTAAVSALRRINPQALLDDAGRLLHLLQHGSDRDERIAAAHALALIGPVRLPPDEAELQQAAASEAYPFERTRTGVSMQVLRPRQSDPDIPPPPPQLSELDPRLQAVPDVLFELALSDSDPRLREQCVYSLSTYGHFAAYRVRSLLPLRKEDDPMLAVAAGECIAYISVPGSLQPEELRTLLMARAPGVCLQAILALKSQPELARSLIPELSTVIRNQEADQYWGDTDPDFEAALLLASLEPLPADAREALAEVARENCINETLLTRERELYELAPYAVDILPEIVRSIESEYTGTGRLFVPLRLAQLDPDGSVAGGWLVKELHSDGSSSARGQAAAALGMLNSCPQYGLDALIKVVESDPDEWVRTAACSALAVHALKNDEALRVIAQYAAASSDYELFNAAGCAITVATASPHNAELVLGELRQYGNRAQPVHDVVAARVASDPAAATALLLQALEREESSWLLAFAIEEAGFRGSAAAACLPRLQELSRGPDESLRWMALCAIGQIDASAAAAEMEQLRDLLSSGSSASRRQSAWILGRMGPAALPAVPDLRCMLYDTDEELRMAAALALWRLGAGAADTPLR